MGGKIFKYSLWAIVGFFVFFFLVGQVARIRWGKDHEHLKINSGDFSFEAHRDAMGVWQISAKSLDDVSFAMGFLQHHDREFQTEMARQMALGNLSAFFGETVFPKDRLMRLLSQVAKRNFEKLVQEAPEGNKFLKSIESYIAGRKAYFDSEYLLKEPFEFSVFGIQRQDFEPWEPWHVAALMRAHTWDLSYDIRDEILRTEIFKIFSPLVAASLVPTEPQTDLTHYSLPGLSKFLNFPPTPPLETRKKLLDRVQRNLGPQSTQTSSNLKKNPLPNKFQLNPFIDKIDFDRIWGFAAEDVPSKGSNLWLSQGADSPMSLCADSHLGTYWPSPLYPAVYKVRDSGNSILTEGVGYFFPGVPWIIQGLVRNPSGDISWGITIANYADSADLIQIDESQLGPPISREIKNKFLIKSPLQNTTTEKITSETWTDYGPRVDEFLDWKLPLSENEKRTALALDWMGFKELNDPGLFFFQRSQKGRVEFEQDLQSSWHFPPVNINWVSTDPTIKSHDGKNQFEVGHQLTGFVFASKNKKTRDQHLRTLTVSERSQRTILPPWERPRFKRTLSAGEEFFFVSANHKVWEGDLSSRMGFHWGESSRPQALLDQKSEILKNPQMGQGLTRSGGLVAFYKNLRSQFSAEDLCGPLPPGWVRECYGILESLDKWQGETEVSRWEPTVVSLWRNLLGYEIWTSQISSENKNANTEILFERWRKNLHFRSAMDRFASDPKNSKSIFDQTRPHLWSENVRQSFRKTHELLITQLGEDSRFWSWGRVHKLDWLHPVGQIPGRLGKVMKGSVFGPELSAPGADDSPLMGNYRWRPSEPMKFYADAAPVLRFCAQADSSQTGIRKFHWANITGPSGNPFSKWSSHFSRESYFKQKLVETEF